MPIHFRNFQNVVDANVRARLNDNDYQLIMWLSQNEQQILTTIYNPHQQFISRDDGSQSYILIPALLKRRRQQRK